MPKITLVLSKALHRKMKAHRAVSWSEVLRRAIARTVRDLERMDEIARRSSLRATDVERLDHVVKEGVRRRYEAAGRFAGRSAADGPVAPRRKP